ncbi:MAG TPA: DUF445 family protein [Gemmatimonadota bacterium]|nr:DUF445 family protein [Gemmatimonadota bacterium]
MSWLRALLTVAFGALAGGITNRVAIWMLFHPYRPARILGLDLPWLQGAVPKNRERLARSIGRTVGTRLLTSDDLAEALRASQLREAFESRLREVLGERAARPLPAPAEILPAPALTEVRDLAVGAVTDARDRLSGALASGAFGEAASDLLRSVGAALDREASGAAGDGEEGDRADGGADGDSMGGARLLRRRVGRWAAKAVETPAFDAAVRQQLERAATELLRTGRTLRELVPPGVVVSLEEAVAEHLPRVLERLGRLLEDPAARARFETAVHELLERFMRDLRFHQRVVARLVVTEETVDNVIRTLEEEGAERLGALLREEEVQAAMARSANRSLEDLLDRPAAEVLGGPDGARAERLVDALSGWVVRVAREPATRDFVLDRLEAATWHGGEGGWEELLGQLPADRIGRWLAAGLRSEAGERVWGELSARLVDALLERPIGSPAALLGPGGADRAADLLAPPLWDWIAGEIPAAAARVRIDERVEEKILEFPIPQLEAIVRSVTQRELDLIVRLGYVLGALIGALLVGATALVG